MHIKFLDHGTGSGAGAAKYLLGELDHIGKPRAGVEVLRGDPVIVGKVADSLPFLHRYTSGVIAWAPEDSPTPEQIDEVLNGFERIAFAGLSPDRLAYSAILHREDSGGVHVHIFAARVDLLSGKSLNISPPGWQKSYDPLRDYYNYKYGWARPDDPARARLIQPGYKALVDASALKQGLKVEPDPKALITEYLAQRIEYGFIKDRSGVISALVEAGLEINRQAADYISVKDPETGKKYRLKGAIYNESFDIDRIIAEKNRARQENTRKPDPVAAESAHRELEAAIVRRAKYNQDRYSAGVRGASARDQKSPENHDVSDDLAGGSYDFSVRGDGIGDVSGDSDRAIQNENRNSIAKRESQSVDNNKSGLDDVHDKRKTTSLQTGELRNERRIEHPAERGEYVKRVGEMPRLRELGSIYNEDAGICGNTGVLRVDALNSIRVNVAGESDYRLRAIQKAGVGINGRVVNAFRKVVEGFVGKLRAANSRFSRALGRHDHELSGFASADRRFVEAVGRIKAGTRKMIENRADELERFKRDINLVEYAQTLGYEIDRRESSKSSVVMRRGDDKVIVATDSDGHGVYFSVRDDKDNGSIIDFVQRRLGFNLGQVRKELRPWIGESATPIKTRHASAAYKPAPSTRDRQNVIASLLRMQPQPEDGHPYLVQYRCISPEVLLDARFADRVRIDEKGNAVFPHYDEAGLCGYELKNRGFTGFSKGGEKALWLSRGIKTAQKIVITESAIDAMSYAQITQDNEAAYVSTGGSLSDKQRDLLRKLLSDAAARGAEIVLATDNDDAGYKLASEIVALAPANAKVVREAPQLKDWNDELKHFAQHTRARKSNEMTL